MSFYCVDLRKEPPTNQNTIDFGNDIVGYKFHNVTKYYENDLVFLSHESKHINLVPMELLEQIEGVIVYFDSDNVSEKQNNLLFNEPFNLNGSFLLTLFNHENCLKFTERFPAQVTNLREFHRTA